MIQDQPRAEDSTAHTGPDSAPLGVFILVVAIAVFLRFWNLGSAGISHWDAGTYTAGPLGVGPYGRGESVLFQTPPLVPSMFKALFDLWPPVDTIAIGAIAILGVGTIVALFLAGRRWVGDTAAIAGTAALAGMHYHLLYSRQALTDVPFAFFLLLAAWAFTAAFDRRSLVLSLVAGLAAGATILTKYHGPLALALPALWLCVWRMRRSPLVAPGSPGARDVPSRRAWGLWLVACGVAAVPAAWLAWEIHRTIGLSTFRESRREWLSSPSLYLLPLTARLVGRSLWEWVSPFALAPALLGFLVMLRRRSSGDLLLLVWTALLLVALPFYRFYPRLLVPLLLPLALAAGVGIEALSRAIVPGWTRGRTTVISLLLLAPGAWASRGVLSLEDRGYELTARLLIDGPSDPRPDVLVTQHAILFYLLEHPHPFVCYEEPGAVEILESGGFRYIVGDLRLLHAPRFREYIAANRGDLKAVAVIANPLPTSTVVNCAGFEGLDLLRSTGAAGSPASPAEERTVLETIRIWRHARPQEH